MNQLQVRAAELLRGGCSQREAARAVGRSERTIRVWLRDVEGFREAAESGPDSGDVSPVDTLHLALGATRGDGSPDWRIRVTAAKALLASGFDPPPIVSCPPGGVVMYPDAIDAVLGET
jgi:Helix-turn-helix domain